MSNVYDAAVIAWANDRLTEKDLPRDATDLRFGGWDDCWSSWTQDYGVSATIVRSDGSEVEVRDVSEVNDMWSGVLAALPAYVAALEEMNQLHDHDSDDPDVE